MITMTLRPHGHIVSSTANLGRIMRYYLKKMKKQINQPVSKYTNKIFEMTTEQL